MENLAWRSNIAALVEDYRAQDIELEALFRGVFENATPNRAGEILDALPEPERSHFEWWFVAAHGDRIPRVKWYTFRWSRPPENHADQQDVAAAFHRAVLARREPI